MTASDDDMRALDAAFAASRRHAPDPSPALMARIVADAEAEAGRAAARSGAGERHAAVSGARALLRRAAAAVGGWSALGGLVAAGAAGLWLGVAPPPALDSLAVLIENGAATGVYDVADLVPAFPDLAEGD